MNTEDAMDILSTHDYTYDDFEEMIDDADVNAYKSEEIDFVSRIREAFESQGMKMRLSTSQLNWLIRIAHKH